MEKYLDQNSSPDERAKDLLEKMSLEEKMGQVRCFFGGNDDAYKDASYGIGQVSTLEMRNITSLEEAAKWQRDLQEKLMKNSPHHIPAVFHMEGLCGAFIQDASSLPSGIGRASSFDPELEEKLAEMVARQETAVGITQILAPVLDISRDSRMGRQGETYGEDPTLAAEKERPASYLKKVFQLDKLLERARLYATAHGIYQVYINGEEVKGVVLAPGTSEYVQCLQYQTYDVTRHLKKGENIITAVLGNGWWRGTTTYDGAKNGWGNDFGRMCCLRKQQQKQCKFSQK